MSPSADVKSIQALEHARTAFQQYRGQVNEVLSSASAELDRHLAWINERQSYWEAQVRRAQAEVDRAAAALSQCMMTGPDDNAPPPCTAEKAALRKAAAALAQVQAELSTVMKHLAHVQSAASAFQREARRLETMVKTDVVKAVNWLDRGIAALRAYQSVGATSSSGPSALKQGAKKLAMKMLNTGVPALMVIGAQVVNPATYREGPGLATNAIELLMDPWSEQEKSQYEKDLKIAEAVAAERKRKQEELEGEIEARRRKEEEDRLRG